MNQNFKNYLLKVTQATDCQETEIIQSLWSGYGKISRIQLINSSFKSIVVKCIELEKIPEHPQGWNTDISHQRKVKSYQVETNWYRNWSQLCTDDCKIPQFIGSFKEGKNQWIVMEDLDAEFPLRKYQLTLNEVKTCLTWLANFHGRFMQKKPKGLWEVGTYWHLATRPDEFEKIANQKLKSKACRIDEILNSCEYQTIVHGDAKLANFCFSKEGTKVAAVDFQYVGGGCGMKDVAYFLGSCLSDSECEEYEKELLDFYFIALNKASINAIDFAKLEEEWRGLYPFAVADFTRFMLGWMPSHQKVNGYSLNKVKEVLKSL
ncbi:MAG: oxidoreductase family protein [Flavobacteriales bacterium]